jgi:lysophospholipase L1-like esterase
MKAAKRYLASLVLLLPLCVAASAYAEESLLSDVNGDGLVGIAAFGDSITYGVGDGYAPGADVPVIEESGAPRGYPKRLTSLLNLSVRNSGVPGEELVAQGVWRLPQIVTSAQVDTVLLMEGSNDSVKQISRGDYARALQRAINVTRAAGKQIVVATIPPPTANHESLAFITESYSSAVRELAAINDVPVADVEVLWRSTCPELQTCDLYNEPEGLHPNKKGYDALSQIFAASLMGVDLLSPSGPSELESALGLPEGAVVVRPPEATAK